MTAAEMIKALQELDPTLPVKFRAYNGSLTSVDDVYPEADTFGKWIEIS